MVAQQPSCNNKNPIATGLPLPSNQPEHPHNCLETTQKTLTSTTHDTLSTSQNTLATTY